MAIPRVMRVAVVVAIIVAALAYLRDPPWLLSYTHGFIDDRSRAEPVRWTTGHAAFFVPADLRAVRLRMRDVKLDPADWPISVVITIDDRTVDHVRFDDEGWREIVLRLPPRGSRNARRIDIKLDRTRGTRGLQFGAVEHLQ